MPEATKGNPNQATEQHTADKSDNEMTRHSRNSIHDFNVTELFWPRGKRARWNLPSSTWRHRLQCTWHILPHLKSHTVAVQARSSRTASALSQKVIRTWKNAVTVGHGTVALPAHCSALVGHRQFSTGTCDLQRRQINLGAIWADDPLKLLWLLSVPAL